MKIKTRKNKWYILWTGGWDSWDLGDMRKVGPLMIRKVPRCR